MKFSHLHVHSHYSLLDGLSKIDQILDACQEMKMDSIALTDHGSMYGVVEFYKKAKKRGIKPIIGNEMYLAPNGMHLKRANIDNKRHHLILLVKNAEGYRNLVKLTTKSYLEGYYYKPRIDKDTLREHSKGLIGLSACIAGEIPKTIINGNIEKAEKLALEYQDIFGKDNFYLEIQHHPNLPEQKTANDGILKIAGKHHIPLIATNDTHYIKVEDNLAQDVLMSIQTDKKLSDEGRLTMKDNDFSLRPPERMIEDFKDFPEALSNTQKIVEKCQFEFELGKMKLPHFQVPGKGTPNEYLTELCYQGLKKRKFDKSLNEVLKRLDYELGVIKETGYASYFLIVADFVNWAKSQNIVVGPGRGSAAGSLVAYLLNVTDVEPLKYNLLFERFLNPERISMPDIDLDFADDRRDEVIKYVTEKYGQDHVAQIITFGTMAARGAVRDVGRVFELPYDFCDRTAKMIPFGLSLKKALEKSQELKVSYQTNPDTKRLIDMAMRVEGVVRHASTHACGVLITKDPLTQIVPCQRPAKDDDQFVVSQYEMHSVEDMGLLKMDFLGLKTLTVIQNTLNQVKESDNIDIDLVNAPLDDQATFQLFKEGNTTGVFQLESSGFKRYLKELRPTDFEDIIAMVALYRPGPMEFIPDFIDRKNGRKKVEYLHALLEPILKNTYGICVYQEQLMQIARDLAGFTLGEADVLRKAVGKKIKKLLNEQKEKMISGMIANNIGKQTAKTIWQTVEPFAQYGFNRSHAACYATIGYRTAYLKAHYPTEFMAALMTSDQNDIERIAFLVNECQKIGLKVLPPDINESDIDFSRSENNIIRFGLKAIKNVGENIVKTIVNERKQNGQYKDINNFIERVQTKDLNKKSLESLTKCGALDAFGERSQLLASVEQLLALSRETQKVRQSGQESLFGGDANIALPNFRLADATPVDKKELLSWEKELLGLYISDHPLSKYREKLAKIAHSCSNLTKNHVGQKVKIGGIITKIKKIITKTGKPMLFAEIEDATGRLELVVFPNVLERTASLWIEDKIILASGKINDRDGSLKMLCDSVSILK